MRIEASDARGGARRLSVFPIEAFCIGVNMQQVMTLATIQQNPVPFGAGNESCASHFLTCYSLLGLHLRQYEWVIKGTLKRFWQFRTNVLRR